ncbi:hypothetical protein RRG08_066560 [Elysia crispata]|uniref:Uncharacterized protein n=1 Tax=Elysia crispata TaxID=231223 RepID=A0AAE0YNM7_9GAST|nr:hypothetical protein RRG08_066560 [Elysia crispata]
MKPKYSNCWSCRKHVQKISNTINRNILYLQISWAKDLLTTAGSVVTASSTVQCQRTNLESACQQHQVQKVVQEMEDSIFTIGRMAGASSAEQTSNTVIEAPGLSLEVQIEANMASLTGKEIGQGTFSMTLPTNGGNGWKTFYPTSTHASNSVLNLQGRSVSSRLTKASGQIFTLDPSRYAYSQATKFICRRQTHWCLELWAHERCGRSSRVKAAWFNDLTHILLYFYDAMTLFRPDYIKCPQQSAASVNLSWNRTYTGSDKARQAVAYWDTSCACWTSSPTVQLYRTSKASRSCCSRVPHLSNESRSWTSQEIEFSSNFFGSFSLSELIVAPNPIDFGSLANFSDDLADSPYALDQQGPTISASSGGDLDVVKGGTIRLSKTGWVVNVNGRDGGAKNFKYQGSSVVLEVEMGPWALEMSREKSHPTIGCAVETGPPPLIHGKSGCHGLLPQMSSPSAVEPSRD